MGAGGHINLVVLCYINLHIICLNQHSLLLSDFLESIKQLASFSDKKQTVKTSVNMASSQIMISLPCYEGFLEFAIWYEEPQSVSHMLKNT